MDKEYSPFNLAFRESEGRLAIWYQEPEGRDFLVDPCALFNAITGDEYEDCFLICDYTKIWYGDENVDAKLFFKDDVCIWIVDSSLISGTVAQRIHRNEFWSKIKAAFVGLQDAMKADKSTYYDDRVRVNEIVRIVEKLDVAELCTRTKTPLNSEVHIDNFEFSCGNFSSVTDTYRELGFTVKIGNQELSACYDGGDNTVDTIRHRIEDYIFNQETKLVLDYDWGSLETVFDFEEFSTTGTKKLNDGRLTIDTKLWVKVVIRSSHFEGGPAIIGICDPKQVFQQMYEAFLNVARKGFRFNEGNKTGDWYCSPMTFYNQMKSLIIEDYLSGIRPPYNSVQARQSIVNHIFIIQPDYTDVVIEQAGDVAPTSIDSDDMLELYDENSDDITCKMEVPGLYRWQREFELHSDGVESTMGNMDVAKWHEEGLRLAVIIREKLPEDCDLWYGYPFEDAENRGKRPFLIYKSHKTTKGGI